MSWHFFRPLDIEAMNKAAGKLIEYTDFTSFSKLHTDVKTNKCHVLEASWREENRKIIFTIKADRFLRNMVRAIVGTMIDIGMGKITLDDFTGIIEGKNRGLAGFSVPAHGLYLADIAYPELRISTIK
jgi:tRNA pseudouridine38-40 synthase